MSECCSICNFGTQRTADLKQQHICKETSF